MTLPPEWKQLHPRAIVCQVVTLRWALLGIGAFSVQVLGGLFLVWALTDIRLADLTRDPLAVLETALLEVQRDPEFGLHALARLEVPFYAGAVSNLGILFWAAGAAVCFFVPTLGRISRGSAEFPVGLFLTFGLLTVALMLDDLFLLHERALPLHLGLDERWLMATYALLLIGIFGVYHRAILRSEFVLLGLSFLFFATSLAVDLLPRFLPQPHFFEDGSKLVGIVCWTTWVWRTARHALVPNGAGRLGNA